jgi:hypothetical protein
VRAATWYLVMLMPGFFCINVEHSLLYIFFKGPNMPTSRSFRKTGIFPFNNKVITNDQTAPSIIYTDVQEDENDTHTEEVENNQDKEQQAGAPFVI